MNNQEQLLTLEETIKRLESQIKIYEEQEERLEIKLDSIKNEKRSLDNLLYKMSGMYSDLKIKILLEEENLNLYKYELSTDYVGTDTIGYVLVKKEINPEIKYADTLNGLALDNLESYGYISEDDYSCLAQEFGIDLDDEEAVENSELADLEISGYDYSIELVTDYSDLDIDIEKVERWD
jgi:hypothetical protein